MRRFHETPLRRSGMKIPDSLRQRLAEGLVIPACPLVLNATRKLDEDRQRALIQYYLSAGAGGLAVGVHTTQFAIRDPAIGLFRPILTLATDELRNHPVLRVGGICGATEQATHEAALIRDLGYDAGLLSLGALKNRTTDELIAH